MRANEKEITCIIYVEKFFKKKGFKNLYQRFFKAYEVEATKSLFNLWRLHGCDYFFLEETIKTECINYWIKVLYNLDFDIESLKEKEIEKIKLDQKRLKEEAIKTNQPMVRKNYGSTLERTLWAFDQEFGNYQS
jgi:hypothetical protein